MIGSTLLLAAAAQSSLLSGLLAYWKLDGNSNNVIGGAAGTDNAITYNAGNGKIVQGAGFVAASLSNILTSFTPPLGAAPRTIACWLRLDASQVSKHLWGYGSAGGQDALNLTIWSGGQFSALTHGSVNTYTTPVIGTWYSVVFEYNGTQLLATINNVAQTPWTIALTTVSSTPFSMGAGPFGGFNFPSMSMDEVGIWDRVWTPAEHTTWYNAGAAKSHPF